MIMRVFSRRPESAHEYHIEDLDPLGGGAPRIDFTDDKQKEEFADCYQHCSKKE